MSEAHLYSIKFKSQLTDENGKEAPKVCNSMPLGAAWAYYI